MQPGNHDQETQKLDVISTSPLAAPDPNDPLADLDPEEREAFEQLKRMRAERRRKKLIRRGIVIGIIVALVVGFFVFRAATANKPDDSIQVVTAPAYTGPFTTEVTGSGSIKPSSSYVVQPQIDGTIDSVNVVAGQTVKAGDVLFTIKNDDLDRAINEAGRGVRTAKQGVDEANQGVKQAKQAVSAAEETVNKAQNLLNANPGNTDLQAALEGAQAELKSARNALTEAQRAPESAQISLEAANDAYSQATERAEQRTVKSPIDGTIVELNAQPGATVGQTVASAGTQGTGSLCLVANLSQMNVTLKISEVDINKLSLDQTANVSFSAVPDLTLSATVKSIASTSSGNDASGNGYGGGGGATYAVELVIPTPDPRLKPGMTADVSIITNSIDSALVVPSAAVTDFGDGIGVVYVEDDEKAHTAHTVHVEILGDNGSETAVKPTEGAISDGDLVIISGMEAATIDDMDAGTMGDVAGNAADAASDDTSGSSPDASVEGETTVAR